MNRVCLSLIVLGLFSLPGLDAFASSSVQFPVGPAAWTINVTPSTTVANPPPLAGVEVVKVEVVQGDRFTSHLVSYFNGASRISYTIAGTSLLLTEDPKGTVFLTPSSKRFNVPFLPAMFDWITPSTLKEKDPITYGQKLCYHYKGPAGEAWIDSKTLFPVALDNGYRTATFTFLPPPETQLALPPKYEQVLDNYAAFMGLPVSKQGSGTN